MTHEIEHGEGEGGILSNKILWICIGLGIFIVVGFVLPTPQSVLDVVEKYGFAEKLIEWEVAHDATEAAHKTMIVLGIIPMAVIFFCYRGHTHRVNGYPHAYSGIFSPSPAA